MEVDDSDNFLKGLPTNKKSKKGKVRNLLLFPRQVVEYRNPQYSSALHLGNKENMQQMNLNMQNAFAGFHLRTDQSQSPVRKIIVPTMMK